MAATKYQLLCRYMSEATNTAITNDMSNEYVKTEEFYTKDHKYESTDADIQAEAEDEKEEMITYGNSSENTKNDMIFAYDGTKKVKHKTYVPDTDGCYVVRDWESIDRTLIGNRGDYTKDFTTIDAESPEMGGTVVCRNHTINNKYFPSTKTVFSNNKQADAGSGNIKYYTESKILTSVKNATIFELNSDDYLSYTTASITYVKTLGYSSGSLPTYYYAGPVFVNAPSAYYGTYQYYNANNSNAVRKSRTGMYILDEQYAEEHAFGSIVIKPANIKTATVPAHYEEDISYPYMIKDTYKRIEMSPWFVYATSGSFEAMLDKAKTIGEAIGLDNIKLVKIVPFDQFLKVK